MNTYNNKPQSWESEMEAGELEQRGVSVMSCIFTVIMGGLLLLVVLIKSQLKSIVEFGVNEVQEDVWKNKLNLQNTK